MSDKKMTPFDRCDDLAADLGVDIWRGIEDSRHVFVCYFPETCKTDIFSPEGCLEELENLIEERANA